MSTADEFRQNAEDCRKQSEKALGAAAKASWLKVAEDWAASTRFSYATSSP
jgi:hypothetical protein